MDMPIHSRASDWLTNPLPSPTIKGERNSNEDKSQTMLTAVLGLYTDCYWQLHNRLIGSGAVDSPSQLPWIPDPVHTEPDCMLASCEF